MTARGVLALDIGGTKLAAGLVDVTGRVRSFLVAPTPDGPRPALDVLFSLGRKAVADAGADWPEVAAVGIGCGGPLDAEHGVLLSPPHLPGWVDVPVARLAADAFGRPAVLDNDGTAAAEAEHRFGAGVGTSQMVYLTLSTGVGGGAVLNGQVYRGATGNGAELGHVVVDWRGRACRGCGGRGCLEAYVSGTSIAERAREALAASHGTSVQPGRCGGAIRTPAAESSGPPDPIPTARSSLQSRPASATARRPSAKRRSSPCSGPCSARVASTANETTAPPASTTPAASFVPPTSSPSTCGRWSAGSSATPSGDSTAVIPCAPASRCPR